MWRVRLRGKDLGDGLVHRVAYGVAHTITWDAGRAALDIWRNSGTEFISLNLLKLKRRREEKEIRRGTGWSF
jgi:hypothetical protein